MGGAKITEGDIPWQQRSRSSLQKDFLEITADGIINITTSRQLLVDIAKAEHTPVDYELLVDFRDTQSDLSITDVYQIAAELIQHGNTFRRKVALLVLPRVNLDIARFFETCSHNRGFSINAFKGYEKAIRWVLSAEDPPNSNRLDGVGKSGIEEADAKTTAT